jgi:hypothetical protein
MEEIVGEVLFDDIALVSATNNKIVDPMGGINLHHVPKDRFATDLHHRLGLQVGLLRKPGPKASCQNDGFHINLCYSCLE